MKHWLQPLLLLFFTWSAYAEIPWPDGAVAHYRVEVSADRPTNDVVVCGIRFFAGGLLAPDSQNIRVTDSKGTALPIQIVYTHPLNACLVLFPVKAGEETYHLFFGGTVTSGTALTNFGRGFFYETRARPEGDSSTWDSMKKSWTAATNSMGVAVLTDTQTRCNPFDESENQFMSRTWGALRVPREDQYKFALFARDQGFLTIDGLPVASTAIDPTAKTQPISDVLLGKGVHALDILQARLSGPGVTALVWLMPWPEYYYANLVSRAIQPAWLPSIVDGMPRDYEVRSQPFFAFFNDFQADMLLAADQPVVMMRFHNRTGGKTDGLTYQWDFGDGTTSAEANPLHVYVKPGRYVVTLTAGGTSKFQKMVLASSFSALPPQKIPMVNSVNPFAAQEMIRLVTPFLDKYDTGTLWTLMALAEQIGDPKLRAETILKLGPLYVAKAGTMPTQVEIPVRQKLADAKVALGQVDAAVAELKQMEPKLEKQRTQRIKLQLQIGKLYQLGAKYPLAIEVYSKIVAEKGGDDPKQERTARIAMGDTYLQQGDLGNARKAYEQAMQIEVGDGRTERERAIRRGSLYSTLRQTVAELSKLALDTSGGSEIGSRETVTTSLERARTSFDSLVFEFPDARLNPDVIYLNASLLQAASDTDGCIAELKTLAKVEPSGRYTLRSTLLESRASYFKKDYEKANSLLEAVLKTTKEEDVVKEATILQTMVKDAIQSKAQFADATKRFWPNNLFADASFEKTDVATNTYPNVEFSTPGDPAKLKDIKVSVVNGFGTDGKRCLMFELPQDVPPPVYVVVRFPSAIGDRVFARCHVLCEGADFRWAELRRTTTQSESIYSLLGVTPTVLQQWGWLEQIANAEPWRELSWRSGPSTAGAPQGYMSLVGMAKEGRKVIPAGTRVYVDAIECYLAP